MTNPLKYAVIFKSIQGYGIWLRQNLDLPDKLKDNDFVKIKSQNDCQKICEETNKYNKLINQNHADGSSEELVQILKKSLLNK
ncbi:MAG: hypothetical protein ABIG10_03755 [bacterium]